MVQAKTKPNGHGDPKEKGAKPPFPEQTQPIPGRDAAMQPKPDHGETSYKGSGKLEGMAAIITGADSGIGRAVAIAYAREGADVIISYLDQDEDAQETAKWVKKAGRRAVLARGDIQDEQYCEDLVQRAPDEFGRLDILVNNAAYQKTFEKLTDITTEELERTFRTNILAMFFLCRAAVPKMKPGGAIINTSSINAFQPSPTLLPYATTKGAIKTFTEGLAQLVAEQGIRVNAVAPGPVWTPLIPSTMSPDKVTNFGKDTPLKRPAQPKELAPVFVLLASPEASYVTGEIYAVTGGKPFF